MYFLKVRNLYKEIYHSTMVLESTKNALILTFSNGNAFIIWVPGWWFWTNTDCLVIDSGTQSVVSTTCSNAGISTSIIFITIFINGTIHHHVALSTAANLWISEIVWLANAFTFVTVNLVNCVGAARYFEDT